MKWASHYEWHHQSAFGDFPVPCDCEVREDHDCPGACGERGCDG